MEHITRPDGTTFSYAVSGGGPPLVLVHGGFSDHHTNWEFVKDALGAQFTLYAVARRGRGETDATAGYTVADEARDVVALLERIGEPVFLLGHSFGAHCALEAARLAPERVRKLILYEAPSRRIISGGVLDTLEALARAGDWDGLACTFFRDALAVPDSDLGAVRASELWPPIVADAKASLADLRAVAAYDFRPERFGGIPCEVLLQIGSESPRDFYVTDALAAVLRDARIDTLHGQAHEGMTTAPDAYVESVTSFLLTDEHSAREVSDPFTLV
jgi:pimeloyl-ACP methyl ester carboxylesterase